MYITLVYHAFIFNVYEIYTYKTRPVCESVCVLWSSQSAAPARKQSDPGARIQHAPLCGESSENVVDH